MKKLFAAALVLFALPLCAAVDAFLKIDGVKGDSTDASHPGWIAISGFSWGANAAGVQGCATNEMHFTVSGNSVPIFTNALQRNETVPRARFDFYNDGHQLENVTVRSVQGNNVTIHFTRCATHAATLAPATTAVKNTTPAPQPPTVVAASLVNPNTTQAPRNEAQLFIDGVGGERFELINLTLSGHNTATLKLREPANGFFQVAAANKKKVGAMTFLVFKFKLVAVKTISWSSDGGRPSETVTFEYGGYDGPPGGYRQ